MASAVVAAAALGALGVGVAGARAFLGPRGSAGLDRRPRLAGVVLASPGAATRARRPRALRASAGSGDPGSGDVSGAKTAEVVSLGAALPEAVESEVVSMSGTRPAKLLYSEGVQSLVTVLTRLKDAPGKGKDASALKTLLGNAVEAWGEIGDTEVPDRFEKDVDEAIEVLERQMGALVTESPDVGLNWRKPLEEFSRLNLARRLPEVADELVPWDSVYPSSLSSKTGVEQMEVRNGLRSFARAVDLQELSTWSEEEFEEAVDLIERNEVLKEVFAVFAKAFEERVEEVLGTAALVAALVALAPVVLAALTFAACCSLLGGDGGGGSTPAGLSPEDLGVLPVYKLGGVGSI